MKEQELEEGHNNPIYGSWSSPGFGTGEILSLGGGGEQRHT